MRRVLIGLVAVATACGSSVAAPAPTTTTSTTATPSTTAAATTTSTTLAPSTTSTTLTAPDWTPACAPFTGGPAPSGPYTEAALDQFGPLPAQPILTVDLPVGSTFEGNPPDPPPAVQAVRIEGGVLLALSPSSGGASKTSILAAVNTDGSKRWVRCIDGRIDGVWAAPPASQPRTAIVAVRTADTATGPVTAWPIVSLLDGSDQGNVADAASAAGVDPIDFANHWQVEPIYYQRPPTSFVVRHVLDISDFRKIDRVLLYDVVTNKMTLITLPSEIDMTSSSLGFSDAGELVVSGGPDGYQVLAVYHDGAWTRERSVLRKAFGVRPFFEGAQPFRLVGVDALGTTVWASSALVTPGLQSTSIGTDGGVTVATVCASKPDPGTCAEYALAGVNTTNGEILWALPGFRLVSAHDNGFVLTTNDSIFDPSGQTDVHPGWVLLDDKTGKVVDNSQQWADPDTFRYGCCGESEFVWLDHAGGVVIAVNNTRVSIWYPKVAAGETHTASIP